MEVSDDFIAGFQHALESLGAEGDYREVDWSAPYKYLQEMREKLNPPKPKTIGGFKIVVSNSLSDGMIEFHHRDGRIDRMMLLSATKQPTE